ncbi:MAG: tetratricopeptide repeat protein [Anaerolineae bacterium]
MDHLQAGRWMEAIAAFEAMLLDYPDDPKIKRILEKARINASLDGKTRVRGLRWNISWRSVLFRVLAVAAILGVILLGFWLVTAGVLPALTEARIVRYRAQLLVQGKAYLSSEDIDRAEESFKALLVQVPDNIDAQNGLADIRKIRDIQTLYQRAATAQDNQDYKTALILLSELSIESPGYRDTNSRIATIANQAKLDTLFTEAETAFNNGQSQAALDKYMQLRTLSATYQVNVIEERLFTTYVRMGRALVEKRPPTPADIPQALDYFNLALVIKPRDPGTIQERRLAELFTKGQSAYQEGRWHEVAIPLKAVFDTRPDYLGTVVVTMLYDAYIYSGDLYVQENDVYRAYNDYLNASNLPVPDLTLAKARLAAILPVITPLPTPEPTLTPVPSLTPRPTTASVGGGSSGGEVQSTPTPTPTTSPADKLTALHNRIVFRSSNPGQTGLWVVDPDGKNREYLGNTPALNRAMDDLLLAYQFSTDKRSSLLVMGTNDAAQIYMSLYDDATGSSSTLQLTYSQGASYDPSWSPDGKRIIYVSQDAGSDDIWSMARDGSDAHNLTPNQDYDKRPSWSPDSRSIVFWSNRVGVQQIFVMDADGKNVRNISNSPWDEYDPIWVR